MSWQEQARCKGMDTAIFFTGRGESVAPAKAVCATCPVRTQCLQFALEFAEMTGVWAGTSEMERDKMRRQSGRPSNTGNKPLAPCGTASAYRRHLRHGEQPCAECRNANRLSQWSKPSVRAKSKAVA